LPIWKVFDMVSSMETDPDTRTNANAALTAAERAAAAPYIDYPPTPRWYPPAVGAWAAALVLTIGVSDHKVVFIPALLTLLAIEGAFLAWYRRYRGTMPSMRQVPTEIARAMWQYLIALVAVVVAIGIAFQAIGPTAGAIVAFLTVTLALHFYERRYAAAAAATRARLS
jgi:hypothetical protein